MFALEFGVDLKLILLCAFHVKFDVCICVLQSLCLCFNMYAIVVQMVWLVMYNAIFGDVKVLCMCPRYITCWRCSKVTLVVYDSSTVQVSS